MNIIMLDEFLNQLRRKQLMAKELVKRIQRELETLVSEEVNGRLNDYFRTHNGKKFDGLDHIYKYRLTKGDRILYTYAKYLPYLKEKDNTLVLLGYSEHDKQSMFGRLRQFQNKHKHMEVEEYLRSLEGGESYQEVLPEDLYTIAEILSPTYLANHCAYIVSDEMLQGASIEELDENPIISSHQAACVEEFIFDPDPTLILGGAGTGKTLISIHILNDYVILSEEGENRVAYFTQSEELRRSAEHRYHIIHGQDTLGAGFFNIIDFCIEKLKLTRGKSRMMTFARFGEEVFSHLPREILAACDANNIDSLSAWTEIRGIIKGQLDHDWYRFAPISQYDFPGISDISKLVTQGWLRRLSEDKTRVVLSRSPREMKRKYLSSYEKVSALSQPEKDAIHYALEYFTSVDCDLADMGRENYLRLSSEDSTLDKNQRAILWSVYEEYKRYLSQMGMYDDNDLARMTLKRVQAGEVDSFDLIVVDEVQDYTEMQIYLLHCLSRNKKQIVYTGDTNQNVNPTLFQEDKLQRLYVDEDQKTHLRTVGLSGNFRCPRETVEVINALSDLRRRIIGRKGALVEETETSGREGTAPFRLQYSPKNVEGILREMMKFPRTAFLVPDEGTKERAIQMVGEEEYRENGVPFIHTVAEIKGMEYAYVVCYELFGKHRKVWGEMFSQDHQKKQTGERYYFNLPYVAMTRTQNHLCFIDKDYPQELEECLRLPLYTSFNADIMYFRHLDNDAQTWLLAARENEANGLYQDAYLLFKRAGAPWRDIRRCEAKAAAQRGDYQRAAKNALVAGDLESLHLYQRELSPGEDLHRLLFFLGEGPKEEIERYKRVQPYTSISGLVERIFEDKREAYSGEELTRLRLRCVTSLQEEFDDFYDECLEGVMDFKKVLRE